MLMPYADRYFFLRFQTIDHHDIELLKAVYFLHAMTLCKGQLKTSIILVDSAVLLWPTTNHTFRQLTQI